MELKIQELKGYKYILDEEFELQTDICGFEESIEFNGDTYVSLNSEGLLRVFPGYAWDGVTGWSESDNTIIPSMVHDALFQLIAKDGSCIPLSAGKKPANRIFIELMKKNGVPKWKRNLFKFAITVNTPSTKYRKTSRRVKFRI